MQKTDAYADGDKEGGQSPREAKPKIEIHKIIVVALVALIFLWFNFSFVIDALIFLAKVFAIFLLCFAGIWSAQLMLKPRRIVSVDQVAQGMTLLQHMQETEQPSTNPFMGKYTWESPVKYLDEALSWEIQRGLSLEGSACFLWVLSIIFLTLNFTDRSMGLSVIASLATTGLLINWIMQLRFFLAWSVINKELATTEHYGIWLFKRIQYGFVVVYCLQFIIEKVGIF